MNNLFDDSTSGLWCELCKKYHIEIRDSQEIYSAIQIYPKKIFKKQKVTILLNGRSLCSSDLAHELLHLKLNYLGIDVYEIMTKEVRKLHKVQYVFDNSLRNNISNFLEHKLIFPEFLRMGYQKNDFLSDINTPPVDFIKIFTIQNQLNSFDEKYYGVKNFLGIYFSLMCSFHPPEIYKEHLNLLKAIEPELGNILDDFFFQWNLLTINDQSKKFKSLLKSFLNKFSNWYESN